MVKYRGKLRIAAQEAPAGPRANPLEEETDSFAGTGSRWSLKQGLRPDIHLLDRQNELGVQKIEFGSLRQPRNRLLSRTGKIRSRNPTRRGLAESCHQQKLDVSPVSPDESGRLFLGGLLASRAHLRFTGRKIMFAG
jgi:hypothetical protein